MDGYVLRLALAGPRGGWRIDRIGHGESRGAALPPARAACPDRRPHAAGSGSPSHGSAPCRLRPGGPRVSFWQLPRPRRPHRVAVTTVPTPPRSPASIELPERPVALEDGAAGSRQPVVRVARGEVAERDNESRILAVAAGRHSPGIPWRSRLTPPCRPGLAAWWLLGQFCSGGSLVRPGRPRPRFMRCSSEISGPAGRAVVLLESDTVDATVHLHLGPAGDRAPNGRFATAEIPRSCGSAWRTSGLTSSAATPAPGTSRPSPGSCFSISPCSGGCGGN